LIALRKASGLSRKQLAKAAGVQQADISKIERGIVNATIGTIAKLAQPLGAQVRMLPRGLPVAAWDNGCPERPAEPSRYGVLPRGPVSDRIAFSLQMHLVL